MDKKKYYSQYKEDKYLDEIFKRSNGLCLEIGGFDGVSGSTTYFFEKLGWQCVIAEPIPHLYQKILANRKCKVLNCAISDTNGETFFFIAEGVEMLSSLSPDKQRVKREKGELKKIKVTTRTLDSVLEENNIKEIDFISIDVEGHELSVLKGLSVGNYKPRILIIENNSQGAGSNEIEDYLKRIEYVKFKITGCNEWYAHQSSKDIYTGMDLLKCHSVETWLRADYTFRKFVRSVIPSSIIRMIRGK